MKTIMLVFGTRPEAIKMCPLVKELQRRTEALQSGTVRLVGTAYDKIAASVSTLLDDAEAYYHMSKAVNPYGDGQACRRIADVLAGRDIESYKS